MDGGHGGAPRRISHFIVDRRHFPERCAISVAEEVIAILVDRACNGGCGCRPDVPHFAAIGANE